MMYDFRRLPIVSLLILLPCHQCLKPSPQLSQQPTRRDILKSTIATATTAITTTIAISPIEPANAVRGAAELDFEYYMRDLVGGNKKEGNVLPSKPPPMKPPRKLSGPLLPLLLNNDCTPSCIPVQALIQQIQQQSSSNNKNADEIAKEIQTKVNAIKEKTQRSFYTKSPWLVEDISDQYYFDFTSYALWKVAAEMIPNNLDRDVFARRIGKLLIDKMQQTDNMLTKKTKTTGSSLVDSTSLVLELLELFKSSGYCKDYKIRTSDDAMNDDNKSNNSNNNKVVFDELDDESLTMGGNVDCLVSIYEPASLGASLQINGEQSRFGPDFVGTSLAAIWDTDANLKSSWEVFFVDAEYRPNPKGK